MANEPFESLSTTPPTPEFGKPLRESRHGRRNKIKDQIEIGLIPHTIRVLPGTVYYDGPPTNDPKDRNRKWSRIEAEERDLLPGPSSPLDEFREAVSTVTDRGMFVSVIVGTEIVDGKEKFIEKWITDNREIKKSSKYIRT